MKVIDLLDKIANGEEVPKKVKYKNKIYEWKEYDTCYGKIWTKKGWKKEFGYVAEENRTYFYLKHCYQDLNDEVEIIEEEPRNIEVCGSLFTRSEYNRLAGIEEDKKIEKIETYEIAGNIFIDDASFKYIPIDKDKLTANEQVFVDKINEIIDKIISMEVK